MKPKVVLRWPQLYDMAFLVCPPGGLYPFGSLHVTALHITEDSETDSVTSGWLDFGRVSTQQHTQESEPQTTAVCILEVSDPVWKIRRKLWIISTTKVQFLSVQAGCYSGSADLKDRLHFTPDLVPALSSLPISSCVTFQWSTRSGGVLSALHTTVKATSPDLCDITVKKLSARGCRKGAGGKNRAWGIRCGIALLGSAYLLLA